MVNVLGGSIDVAHLTQSRALIAGGEIGELSLEAMLFSVIILVLDPDGSIREELELVIRPSCGELRGGTLRGPVQLASSDLFVIGPRFNLPFGETPVSASGSIQLQGELSDGTPIDVAIAGSGRLLLVQTPPSDSFLAIPGSFCPSSVVDTVFLGVSL
jgi:hypothetical protein